jgi:alkylation response protein AidB-like acyl-CoA dehydrogenase
MMDFGLSEEQCILRDGIRRFTREKLNSDIRERDRDQVFRRELWLARAKMGLTGLPVPEAYGGAGLSDVDCRGSRGAGLRL